MTLAVVEQIYLLEHPGPAVTGHLVDDLHCVLHLGVHVEAGLHRGVSTLAQNFTGKPVDFL